MRYRTSSRGFALPTVVIASVVLFTILVASVGAASSMRTSLGTQYYESLASDAAESGVAHANSCLKANGNVSTWTGAGVTLRPETDCTGTAVTDQAAYIVNTTNYRSKYTVSQVTTGAAGTQIATVTGVVELLRASGGVWKSVTKVVQMKAAAQISSSSVVFGYYDDVGSYSGAFFGAIGGDNKMRTVGFNWFGQLGNGSRTDTKTPTLFNAPGQIVRAYTSFLSMGSSMVAVDSNGDGWAAGGNDHGELGVGSVATPITTPQKVILPNNAKVMSATINGSVNYFLGSDNNVYASGNCNYGTLGNTAGTCSGQYTPIRVQLPTPVTSDPNTIPTSQIVADRSSAYVVMAGGALYAWGRNDMGQTQDTGWPNTLPNRTTPVKIGSYGDPGQPRATQAVTDGDTLYVLDSTGRVNSVGLNTYGEMGNYYSSFYTYDANGNRTCMDDSGGNGSVFWLFDCNGSDPQKFAVRWWNNSIQAKKSGACVDTGGGTANGTQLKLTGCAVTGSPEQAVASQRFIWEPTNGARYGRFRLSGTTKCIDDNDGGGSMTNLQIWDCADVNAQRYTAYNGALTPVDTSRFGGYVTKIATDMWSLSMLTANGEVWSVGTDWSGQFGGNRTYSFMPQPVQFVIPDAGVTAVDIFETSTGVSQNLYVIGSNGKVYGSGNNGYGQLGNNATAGTQLTPVAMQVIDGTAVVARQVQSGYGTTVVYTADGSVYTVGNNSNGQLGDGTQTNSKVPIRAKYVNDLRMIVY